MLTTRGFGCSVFLLYSFSIATGAPIIKDELDKEALPICLNGWKLGPGPGGWNCYSFKNFLIEPVDWFKAGEICVSQMSYLAMPKTKKQRDAAMIMWEKDYHFWNPNAAIYVGLTGMAGYWAWLDNSTFDSTLWCDGIDTGLILKSSPIKETCAVMKPVEPFNPKSGFCFERVQCAFPVPVLDYVPMCQKVLSVEKCANNWVARPETNPDKTECYQVSSAKQKTSWRKAFCACMEQNSSLADIVTLEEASWLAGDLLVDYKEETILLGLTALNPLSGWTWLDGTPLQTYTKPFWMNHTLPPTPGPHELPDKGNQCSALMWLNEEMAFPRLQTYDCESGLTHYVCKMTPDTQKGVFSKAAMEIQAAYC